jgi:MFS family permease
MAGLGFVVGMVGGGVITALWGWRWIFLLNVPITLLMLLPVRRAVPESRAPTSSRSIDVGGAAAVTVGVVALIFALTSASRSGWLAPATWGVGLLGLASLTLFVVIERRHSAALLSPEAVAGSGVLAPNGAVLLQSMVGVAWLYLLTFYFQDVRGMDPLVSGLWFAPMTVASVIGAVVAGRATVWVGTRATAMAGLLILGGSVFVMALAVDRSGGFGAVIASMVVGEAGFMLGSVALTIVATSRLGDQHAGLAAGLINTSTQLGGGFGLGIVATVAAATASQAAVDPAGLKFGFLTCLAFVVPALILAAIGSGDPSPAVRERPPRSASTAPR